jgi:hypothetical protein
LFLSAGQTSFFLKLTLTLSSLICTCHLAFQTYLFFKPEFANQIDFCNPLGRILTLIGFTSVFKLQLLPSFRLFLIDFVLLASTCILQIFTHSAYVLHKLSLTPSSATSQSQSPVRQETSSGSNPPTEVDTDLQHPALLNESHSQQQPQIVRPVHREAKIRLIKIAQLTRYFFELMFLVLLATSGTFSPSAVSAVYFVSLLGVLTLFAVSVRFSRFYEYFRLLLCLFCALHLITLFCYQLDSVQNAIPPDSFAAKYDFTLFFSYFYRFLTNSFN